MNKSSLLVKITYILVSTSHAKMLRVDHSNIDGPPLAVKCVRKFGSPPWWRSCVCVYVCYLSLVLFAITLITDDIISFE